MKKLSTCIALALALAAATAWADVVLNPGTVTGTVSLSNWPFSAGSSLQVSVSGNANGFSASSMTTDPSHYVVTVEGNQTYSHISVSLPLAANVYPRQTTMTLDRSGQFTVPVSGTVQQDFNRPGATAAVHVVVTGGAQVNVSVSGYGSAVAGGVTDSWNSQVSSAGSGDVTLPLVAGP